MINAGVKRFSDDYVLCARLTADLFHSDFEQKLDGQNNEALHNFQVFSSIRNSFVPSLNLSDALHK